MSNNQIDRDDYYQEKYEELQNRIEAERENRWQEERKERLSNLERASRSANSWKEALIKKASVYQKEGNLFPDDSETPEWLAAAQACRIVSKKWDKIAQKHQKEREKLMEELAKIEQSIVDEAKQQLSEELKELCPKATWLISDFGSQEKDPSDWLNW